MKTLHSLFQQTLRSGLNPATTTNFPDSHLGIAMQGICIAVSLVLHDSGLAYPGANGLT
jgi:hypothetical protein